MCKQNKVLLRTSIISEVCNAIMVSVGGRRRRQCRLNGTQGFDGWQEVNKWWLFIIRPSPGTHTHTHSHTHIYTLREWKWTSGEMQSTVGQFSRKVTKRGGDPVTWEGPTGAPEQTPQKPRDHADAAGGSHEDRERRDFCLDTDRQTGEIRVNPLNPFSHALWESHTLQHTLHALHPPLPLSPPCNKECEWKQAWTKWRRKKTSLGSDGGIWSPRLDGKLTSRAVICKTSQIGRHGRQTSSQADTEGMLGEESDDVGQQQSHLIPPEKLQS